MINSSGLKLIVHKCIIVIIMSSESPIIPDAGTANVDTPPVVDTSVPPQASLGPLPVSEQERNATLLYKIEEAQRRMGRAIDPESGKTQIHRFWNTQPIPPFSEFVVHAGQIAEPVKSEQLAFKGANGTSNYYWSDFELSEFAGIYSTDAEKYTVHSPLQTMLAWAGGYNVHRVGIRRTSNNKLVGAIIGREITACIQGENQHIMEMGWMYVVPVYRKHHMAEYLIKEFQRVASVKVPAALFSTNFILPTPTSTWSTCIRELQPEKLTSLIPVDEKESIDEKARALELRPEFLATGLRRAISKDAESIAEFLEQEITSFDIWQKWTPAQIEALITNGTCWVVEKFEQGCDVGMITDVVAWVDQEWHPRTPWDAQLPIVKVAHVILQAFGCESDHAITKIITDLMKHAKEAGYHIFQTEKIGDTELYASNLRFVEWGYPRYLNTYNYRIPSLGAKQLGYPIGWNV